MKPRKEKGFTPLEKLIVNSQQSTVKNKKLWTMNYLSRRLVLRGGLWAKTGFTLMEIIVVLIIVAMLALFALPNVPKVRRMTEKKGCIGNLWIIKMAKDQWALDENKVTGTSVEWSELVPDYLDQRPVCPKIKTSSSYTLNVVGTNPTCNQEGHVIEY